MPIVIMPNGEMVDSVTGNPVNTPTPVPNNMGEMLSKIPSQRSMSNEEMDMKQRTGATLTVEEKIMALMDMGLTQGEAIDAIAMEESAGSVNPQMFAGTPSARATEGAMGNMGVLGGMQRETPMAMPIPRGSTNMGMPEDAMVAQRMNKVDTSGMSPQQIEMLRMGRDPFAEGMIGR